MPLKLQFLVMSSGEDNPILAQLMESLSPWPVLIHQDASRERPPMPSMMRRGVRWARPAVATGWRAYAPMASERQKLLSRLRTWYFGETPELEQQHSMSVLHRHGRASGWGAWRAATTVALTRVLASGRSWPAPDAMSHVDRHPDRHPAFAPASPPSCAVGSVWFGASRAVCERMLTMARSADFQALIWAGCNPQSTTTDMRETMGPSTRGLAAA